LGATRCSAPGIQGFAARRHGEALAATVNIINFPVNNIGKELAK
jgi:hypothetical protein